MTDLQRRIDQIDGYYKALKNRENSLTISIESMKKEIEILTKTSIVLKHLLDVMVKDEINRMSGLITYGLKTVFNDQILTFVPEITKKNEKIHIELKTIAKKDGKEIIGDYKSFGGSVSAVESLLLRILCMLKKKYARFIVLDETFAPIGPEYIGNTYKLVSELCKKLNMDVLLVTQLRDNYENADHIYKVKETSDGLAMERLK